MPFFPETSIFSRSSDEWSRLLYDDREICATPPPQLYSIALTTTHLITIPIYMIAFYSLYAEKSSSFRIYKKYLVTHTISNFLFEMHLSIVMRPVLYLPYPVIRLVGAYHLRYVNGNIWLFVFVALIDVTGVSIVELFSCRMRLISGMNIGEKWIARSSDALSTARHILYILMVMAYAALGLIANGFFDQIEHKRMLEISTTYPEIMCASGLTVPMNKEAGFKPIHLFNILAFVAILYGSTITLSMGVICHVALKRMMSTTVSTSLKTTADHQNAPNVPLRSFLANWRPCSNARISDRLLYRGLDFQW